MGKNLTGGRKGRRLTPFAAGISIRLNLNRPGLVCAVAL
jgi:hypothetical protein